MIEVLVSALVILIVAGAVLSLMSATTRSAADQRTKAAAYSAAQEDQARLRAMRLSSLNRLDETRTVSLDGSTFTVESKGVFVNSSTGTDSSCEAEGSSADYVRITSTVTWNGSRTPVTIDSIVAPSTASLDPNHGSLIITATNGQLEPLSGLGLSGSGAGTFSGSTDANGCANFADLPAGNYTLSTSATGFVDADGNYSPWATTVGVVASASTPLSLMYDLPGTVLASFNYRVGSSSEFRTAYADSIVAYNALMPSGAKGYGSPGGTRTETVEANPLFPFKEADTIYAGSCESNLPESAAAKATVIVPANGTVKTPQIQLPALNLTAKREGSPIGGARVTVTDESCRSGGSYVKREYTTDSSGAMVNPATHVPEPGLPWGRYQVCVSIGERHRYESRVSVKNLTSGTNLTVEVPTGGWGSGGECP